MVLIALTLNACGGDLAGGSEHQQTEGRPLPKYGQASLPAADTTPRNSSPPSRFASVETTGDSKAPRGRSAIPSIPTTCSYRKSRRGRSEISFFNLRKLKGIYKPKGPTGATEPVPPPDELVGWFQHHPYLETSEPEPVTVGGYKGVQFDVVLANLPENYEGLCGKTAHCLDIFALSTGGSSEIYYLKRNHYLVLENVEGVPVAIDYSNLKDEFDEFVPVAEKVLESVRWTDD